MWRRIFSGLAALATVGVWQLAGCGSDTAADIADAGDEGGDNDATSNSDGTPGGDGGSAVPEGSSCLPAGNACLKNADCCSVVCDPTAKKCVAGTGPGNCKGAGATCAKATDCCSLTCQGGSCGAACISDNGACTSSPQCCGGNCTGGKCVPLNPTCKTSGNACSTSGECCSKLCNNGFCQIGSSFCTQNGDVCTSGPQCCGGVCTIAAGASVGTCGAPPAGATLCPNGIDGTVCGDCTECCSRLCAPFISGVKVCQPANGCRIDGDLCTKSTDCCGGDPASGLPGAGNVTCDIASGYTIGVCRNPMGCNPEGNVCHYLNYSCGDSSSARNDCCDHLGSKSDCTLDAVGVPRCHVIGSDGGPACRNPGQTCAFTGDCCNGLPCVPGPNGELVCYTTPCVPTTGPCTVNADCCNGNFCQTPPGSTQGTCNPIPGGGGSDGGPTGDGGTTCALYGQSCATSSDCCNNVPCTYQGLTACGAGQAGCTCTDLIPR